MDSLPTKGKGCDQAFADAKPPEAITGNRHRSDDLRKQNQR